MNASLHIMCTSYVHLVPVQAFRGQKMALISWSWIYRWLWAATWVVGIQSGSYAKVASVPNCWTSSLSHWPPFKNIFIIIYFIWYIWIIFTPKLLPQWPLFIYPINFKFSSLEKSLSPIYIVQLFLGVRPSLKYGPHTRGHTTRKTEFPSPSSH